MQYVKLTPRDLHYLFKRNQWIFYMSFTCLAFVDIYISLVLCYLLLRGRMRLASR